jgi:hypothetical protein
VQPLNALLGWKLGTAGIRQPYFAYPKMSVISTRVIQYGGDFRSRALQPLSFYFTREPEGAAQPASRQYWRLKNAFVRSPQISSGFRIVSFIGKIFR